MVQYSFVKASKYPNTKIGIRCSPNYRVFMVGYKPLIRHLVYLCTVLLGTNINSVHTCSIALHFDYRLHDSFC